MKFFNLDCHVSVIADIKKILESLGHEVVSYSISGHNWVFNRQPTKLDIINTNNWRQLNEDMCNSFYERYKDELSEYDGFICTYPLTFSLLYEKFKKPIILHIPIRYETPFESNPEQYGKYVEANPLDEYLVKMYNEGVNGRLKEYREEANAIRKMPDLSPRDRNDALKNIVQMQNFEKRHMIDAFEAFDIKP